MKKKKRCHVPPCRKKKKSSYYFPESIKVKGTLVRKTKKILGFSETLKEVTSLDTIR